MIAKRTHSVAATNRKKHGPGHWLCWPCFDKISDNMEFDYGKQWLTKPNPGPYRSKGGKCARCGKVVAPGELAAKVTLDAYNPLS